MLITALTLPVSLVGTFAFVKLFGFSINTLTLFGLTLATGLVVDDAIVVIENIERLHGREQAVRPLQAAREGMQEVAGAVVAISIVLVAVFVPVALFPGTTGAIYRQFALTIAASVALSTFCALTLTPALTALLLKQQHGEKWIFFRKVDQVLDWTRDAYGAPAAALRPHPRGAGGVRCSSLRSAPRCCVFRAVPTGFIPDEDQGYLIISVQGPEGMSLDQTEKVARAGGGGAAKAQPEVRAMFAIGGSPSAAPGPTTARSSSASSRGRSARARTQSVAGAGGAAARAARRRLAARGVPFQPPAIRGVGSVGGFQFIVEETSAATTR